MERNFLQRLFLAYWPKTISGWLLHTLFYMFLGGILLSLALDLAYLDPETGQQTFFVTFGALVLFLLPMLFVRLLAIRVERRAEEKGAAACQAKV